MTEAAYKSAPEWIRRAQHGDEQAMEHLVQEHDALVRFVVKKYLNRGKEYDDLYQLGRLGLVRAVRNFDESFGVRFSTYAVPMIMGEIRRYLRDDGQMRVSRTIRENAQKVLSFVDAYESAHGGKPALKEICENCTLSGEDALLALNAMKPVKSLSEPIDNQGEILVEDTLGVNPFEGVDKKLLLSSLLSALDERERLLIKRRYFDSFTQTRVAEEMGLTQVQVSRMEKRVLQKMRALSG